MTGPPASSGKYGDKWRNKKSCTGLVDEGVELMTIEKSRVPTLVDVAREAGVSLKTASRVLNRSVNVSQEKKLKIQAVMDRLGYRPNELARGLKAKRSAALG